MVYVHRQELGLPILDQATLDFNSLERQTCPPPNDAVSSKRIDIPDCVLKSIKHK